MKEIWPIKARLCKLDVVLGLSLGQVGFGCLGSF